MAGGAETRATEKYLARFLLGQNRHCLKKSFAFALQPIRTGIIPQSNECCHARVDKKMPPWGTNTAPITLMPTKTKKSSMTSAKHLILVPVYYSSSMYVMARLLLIHTFSRFYYSVGHKMSQDRPRAGRGENQM